MNLMLKSISAIALSLSAATALAVPTYLTTHNNTNMESNAFIAGTIPSPYPTAAHATNSILWNMVRIACYGHTTNDRCSALIKMNTNSANPIEIGYVSMEMSTGDITPKVLSAKGFTLTVNGPGEATITKD